jgi:NAD(P)-dependent dehydrogenase (short-subunit alcohol dehydrogenase family)
VSNDFSDEEALPDNSRMVNNAGVGLEARRPALCHLTDEDVWDITMNINAKSVFLGCKYATAQMLQQEPHCSGDRGWIINMSSIMGIIAGQDNRQFGSLSPRLHMADRKPASYCASKGAVSNLTRQVALDYAKYRIHVNALCPGCK